MNCQTDMPDENYKLKFKDFDKQYLNELVIFYDLECILRNTEKNANCTKCLSICKCIEDDCRVFTEIKQTHVPVIYSICNM